MRTMYYVGFCSFCGDAVGIRICASQQHAVFMCDECNAVWTNAELKGEPVFPDLRAFLCPHCDDTLAAPNGHWATSEEVEERALTTFVVGTSGTITR